MTNQTEQRELELGELVLGCAMITALEMLCEHFTPAPQYVRETPKIGRNEICPCGSNKKYKKCCG
jgi:uncharacterized protein YecA (UPF0149 family)